MTFRHFPRPMKLLIADDSAAFRRLVKSLFPAATTRFLECADGEEAVFRYDQERPDWTLMDIEMKGVDGLTATAMIRARHPHARILIVTQYDDSDLRANARTAGASAYILKDNLAELRRFIAENSGLESVNLSSIDPVSTRERNLS
jgi:CheY-like chemotaxis protein